MRKYSVIVPVFNRPEEIDELLESLTKQTHKNFEVLVIEDGSTNKCEARLEKYIDSLDLRYFYKENTGQGFSRNFGYDKAIGDYFVVFDSDCIIPTHYFEAVEARLNTDYLDAYGGPDKALPNFTDMQKAINYSMTSIFTTGGIRGGEKHVGVFHPRSFNMGISKEVYAKVGGYRITRMGEDIEYSIRIIENGFKSGLISDAFVYHKRRASLSQFFKQLHFFGRARINISRFYPKELKLVHAFPAVFFVGVTVWILSWVISKPIFFLGSLLLAIYFLAIFIDSTIKNKSLKVGFLSVSTAFVQLCAYGIGFLSEGWKKLTKG